MIEKQKISDLAVITKAKNLVAYIMDVTEKSPKQYRVVFTNRMQNSSLDIMELLVAANFTHIDTDYAERKNLQKQAYVKLKVLSNITFIAMQNEAIKRTHFTNITKLIEEINALLVSWGRSDEKRVKAVNNVC